MLGDVAGGSLISPDGVTPIRMVGVAASVIFPCTTKSRRFLPKLTACWVFQHSHLQVYTSDYVNVQAWQRVIYNSSHLAVAAVKSTWT